MIGSRTQHGPPHAAIPEYKHCRNDINVAAADSHQIHILEFGGQSYLQPLIRHVLCQMLSNLGHLQQKAPKPVSTGHALGQQNARELKSEVVVLALASRSAGAEMAAKVRSQEMPLRPTSPSGVACTE